MQSCDFEKGNSRNVNHVYQIYKNIVYHTPLKTPENLTDFFTKCDQIRSSLRIWSHLLKNTLRFHGVSKEYEMGKSHKQAIDWTH